MGRSDKSSETEAKRSVPNAPSADAGAAAALGSLQAVAALETLLKSAQGVAPVPTQLPNEVEQLLMAAAAASGGGGGFDPLQSLARTNPALLSRLAKNVLPRSAPVSSLLPPLPPEGLTPQALLALQTQLAAIGASPTALLGAAGAAAGGLSAHSSLRGGSAGSSELNALQQLLATQVAASTTPKSSVTGSIASSVTPDMQSWSLERLEQHVNLLNQLKQPVPEPLAVLLADAKRKEAKKTAKRLANRKSASSSRARKKALVQEMTELNARLKRQAQILALLPDLVITINVGGVVTFCSAQVERVLHHQIEDIVGAQLSDLLVPTSRDKLNRLVARLVESEQMATLGVGAADTGANESGIDTEHALGNASNNESAGAANGGENASEVAVVSEPSFPLSVVKVKAKEGASDENDVSDDSAVVPGSKGPSSLTQDSASIPRSPTASSLGNSGSDDAKNAEKAKASKKILPSSDLSNSSSLSTTANKVQKANQNLEKNVRAHNKKMKKKGCPSYRDDVTGADVTANNASARLSSLQHRPESPSEEDSGYRESNDSREETSSSASDSSSSNRRRRPIAPTCTICLVRKDLSTIWCEVTSSIRTVEASNRDGAISEFGSEDGKSRKAESKVGPKSEEGSAPSESEIPPEKELLLCLRPIRDGEVKMDEKMRFGGIPKKKSPPASPSRSDSSRPPKKRRLDAEDLEEEPPYKKATTEPGQVDTEVVQSLMAMNEQVDA